MKKAILTVVLTAIVIVGFGLISSYAKNRPNVPEAFTQARIQGAEAATKISQLVSESLKNLEAIELADHQYDYTSALLLVSQELRNAPVRVSTAIELATHMEAMAQTIPEIRPAEARQLAVEAVSAQVAAATRLTSYNSTLAELFEVLRAKFQGRATDAGQVKTLVEKINEQAKAINELNEKSTASLAAFDSLFLKK